MTREHWFDLAWLNQWWDWSPGRKPRSAGPATRLYSCGGYTVEARSITRAKAMLRWALKLQRPPRTRDIEVTAA